MSNIKGSCICKAVTYQVIGDIKKVVNCHCNLCRKMNGAAFSTYAAVLTADFTLLSGELRSHQVSEHATKHFCSTCGTPIFNSNPNLAGLHILHFGSLDTSKALTPNINIYCESEISWAKNVNAIPSIEQGVG